MKNQRIHLSRGDLLFQILVYTVLGLLSLIVLYPLIYVVSASFTSPAALVAGKMYLWPVNPTVSSYKAVLRESRLWIGYKNTIFYTLLGVSINIVMTVLGAYPLSRKDLVGRKVIMTLITFTMFFSGGMIPLYLIIRKVINWQTPVAYIATVAVLTVLFRKAGGAEYMLYSIFGGGLFLGAFFMATDYATSPVTKKGQLIYGIGCGLFTVFIRYFGSYNEGVCYSIMVMNCCTALIDKCTKPTRFGVVKSDKKEAAAK